MSYDVDLLDENGEEVLVPHFSEGGTQVVGGTDKASLSITYNYSKYYYRYLDSERGIDWLDNKKAEETIGRLVDACAILGSNIDDDYWKPVPGNAGWALRILLDWAIDNPEATWRVS